MGTFFNSKDTVLHVLRLVESTDAEPWLQRNLGCGEPTINYVQTVGPLMHILFKGQLHFIELTGR